MLQATRSICLYPSRHSPPRQPLCTLCAFVQSQLGQRGQEGDSPPRKRNLTPVRTTNRCLQLRAADPQLRPAPLRTAPNADPQTASSTLLTSSWSRRPPHIFHSRGRPRRRGRPGPLVRGTRPPPLDSTSSPANCLLTSNSPPLTLISRVPSTVHRFLAGWSDLKPVQVQISYSSQARHGPGHHLLATLL
ncbi:hypothetical protein NDU88_006575 [Pleurodeles waltl]|uniref:Uncharacterized protein n=1 Tax=Pleurodeles waltl TaxID=8319 RepID=A0AAV7PIR2_PLEWA|nr:hypothetical protein NDU88_006575 [Pleurodeles waltl]